MTSVRSVFVSAIGALLILALSSSVTAQTVDLRVDGDDGLSTPTQPEPGGSWDNAYKYLQDGLAQANWLLVSQQATLVRIWVAATDEANPYRPDLGSGYSLNDRTASFYLIDKVRLYGGFLGLDHPTLVNGEEYLWQRDVYANETVLTGDLNGNDSITGNEPGGVFIGRDDNSLHVVRSSHNNDTARIDGFTIRSGYADGNPADVNYEYPPPSDSVSGGGMYCLASQAYIVRCTFLESCAGNSTEDYAATGYGGALSSGGFASGEDAGNITVVNCAFVNNRTLHGGKGGAVHNKGTARFHNCLFAANQARSGWVWSMEQGYVGEGGAIHNFNGEIELLDCTIADNTATSLSDSGSWLVQGTGGGIFSAANEIHGASVNCTNSVLWGNRHEGDTGGRRAGPDHQHGRDKKQTCRRSNALAHGLTSSRYIAVARQSVLDSSSPSFFRALAA